ncbi:SDR family oxidoreductase [Streptomyces gobiensis]|uniref:SDR family oxidoreductase n=1 Tax=Streptomyces gobiensis TaxID=2875706 RepID=UPI001E3B7CCE|nr:NAD(P)H-binding protein [Streptomyces gobiensis]UGY94019.1 NAD(P)H-binding protein [Streptomyces gobiensis]
MDSPILVTGGTGTLGREVVRLLLEDKREVRVMSRRARPEGDTGPYEWARADLVTGEGTDAAVAGAGAIVHCATTRGKGDAEATRRLVQAARRAGNPHLVYISIVGIDRVPMFYYRAKLAAERIIEESGLPWTTLRTTQFHDLIAMFTAVQRWLPVTLTLGGGVRLQPIEVREVAARLAELAVAEPAGRVEDMGGPQVRTAVELTRTTLRAYGRRRPVLPLRWPGASFRALREGGLLAPDHAVGQGTFDDFLAR